MGLHFFTESDIIRVPEGLCLHHSFCNALPHTILICTFSTFPLPAFRAPGAGNSYSVGRYGLPGRTGLPLPAFRSPGAGEPTYLLVGTAAHRMDLEFHYLPADHQEPVILCLLVG